MSEITQGSEDANLVIDRLILSTHQRLEHLLQQSGCDFSYGKDQDWGLANPVDLTCSVRKAEHNEIFTSGTLNISPGAHISIVGQNNVMMIAAGTELRGTKIDINGQDNLLVLGPRSSLRGDRISVSGSGSTVVIGAGSTWVGGGQLLCESDGDHIIVADDCMFAHGVVLRTSDGHSIFDRDTKERLNTSQSIVVHHHVWLANSVRVTKGTVIGTGTVVGQTSIVRGLLEPNSLYVGSPAAKRRSNIAWSRSAKYEGIPERFR